MLRKVHIWLASYLLAALFPALTSCASEHFFPRVKPLFVGLNEAAVPAKSRTALAKAKVDFQLARHASAPQYAHYVGTAPYTNSKIYEGDGYRVTLVNKNVVAYQEIGPDIVLDPSVTGGSSYHYNEVDRIWAD